MREENIRALTKLGLTTGQAKVYLTLATLEKATAKEVSDNSDVARQEVYRLLAELEEKSLIERILASPTQFKAVPIEEGFSILIRRKEKDISEIKKETSKILEDFKQNNAKPTSDGKVPQFAVIPGKEAVVLRLKKMTKKTEKTIDMIVEGHWFGSALFELFEVTTKALRKGVRIRVIVNNPGEKKVWRKVVQEFVKNPRYKLKTLTVKNNCAFAIYDKKEVFMVCFSRKDFADSPALWSNNANGVEIAQNYFESMWEKAA